MGDKDKRFCKQHGVNQLRHQEFSSLNNKAWSLIQKYNITRQRAFKMARLIIKLELSTRQLYDLSEIAKLTGKHKRTVYRWVHIYYCLPGYMLKDTNKIVVPANALIEFIESNFNTGIIRDDTGFDGEL